MPTAPTGVVTSSWSATFPGVNSACPVPVSSPIDVVASYVMCTVCSAAVRLDTRYERSVTEPACAGTARPVTVVPHAASETSPTAAMTSANLRMMNSPFTHSGERYQRSVGPLGVVVEPGLRDQQPPQRRQPAGGRGPRRHDLVQHAVRVLRWPEMPTAGRALLGRLDELVERGHDVERRHVREPERPHTRRVHHPAAA